MPRKFKKRLKEEVRAMAYAWFLPLKIHGVYTKKVKYSFEKKYDVIFSLARQAERHNFTVNAAALWRKY